MDKVERIEAGKSFWIHQVATIEDLLNNQGYSIPEVAKMYDVSKQTFYTALRRNNVQTPRVKSKQIREKYNSKQQWLYKNLMPKDVTPEDRAFIVENLELPDYCPALGCKLDYSGEAAKAAGDRAGNHFSSPSVDRIEPGAKYSIDNIHILSRRANVIKNDANPDELMLVAEYMKSLTQD